MSLLQHQHLIVSALVTEPPTCPEFITGWMRELVRDIGMQVLAGPISIYSDMAGNRGLTSAVILNTSHACLHTWDEAHPARLELDVYSCSNLDIQVVFQKIQQFKPVEFVSRLLDRGLGITDIPFTI